VRDRAHAAPAALGQGAAQVGVAEEAADRSGDVVGGERIEEQPGIADFMARAQHVADTIELDFLWECSPQDEFSYETLARDYFGHAPSAREAAALLTRLHGAPMYFYKKGRGRYKAAPFASSASQTHVSPGARLDEGVTLEGPCFIDEGATVKHGARIGPYSVIGRQCWVEEHATIERAILWPNSRISQEAVVRGAILGRHCHIGRNAVLRSPSVLGDKTVITDFSHF